MADETKPITPSSPSEKEKEVTLTTAGQRKVNLIWEYTQATISILVVLANMALAVYQGYVQSHSITQNYVVIPFPTVLSSSLFLVVGFYFSRTNHSAIGGVGAQPTEPYVGR